MSVLFTHEVFAAVVYEDDLETVKTWEPRYRWWFSPSSGSFVHSHGFAGDAVFKPVAYVGQFHLKWEGSAEVLGHMARQSGWQNIRQLEEL